MLKIWQKLILKKSFKFIIFFLLSIYILYFIIDFSSHSTKVFSKNIKVIDSILYYFHSFVINLNLFLFFAFLLSIIKIIYKMNFKNEILSLQTSGVSFLKLSYPIFFVAFIISSISFLNLEFLTPKSSKYIEDFKNSYTRSEKRKKKKKHINSILLENGTKLVYQKYLPKENKLYDIFFIKSINDIFYIKYLDISKNPKKGFFVDHFIRKNNKLEKKESFKEYDFSFDKIKSSSFDLIENRSISTLFSQLFEKKFISLKEKSEIMSHLNYKLAIIFFPFLITLSIFPICLKFSKKNLFFIITSISSFFYIAFYSFIDSMLILAENRVASPFLLIWTPMILFFLFFSIKFFKKS